MAEKKSTNSDGYRIVNKISTAILGITQDQIRDAVKKGQTLIFKVYGNLVGVQYGTGQQGDWTKFTGQIEAVNAFSGEIFRSGALFLPSSVTPILEAEILNAKNGEDFAGLVFAYDVSAIKSDVPIGYEYRVKSLMAPDEEKDPLLAMRKKIGQGELLTS